MLTIIPRLVRFYGGSVSGWEATSWDKAMIFHHNIAKLKAEEALDEYMVIAVGNGNLEKEDMRRVLDGWKESAGYRKPKAERVTRAGLAGFGIGVQNG